MIESLWFGILNIEDKRVTHCIQIDLSNKEIEQDCLLSFENQALLNKTMDKMKLSARAYHRILKLARTIADLAGEVNIGQMHLAEAIQYRGLDRNLK